MYGRNGIDAFGRFLIIASLVCTLLSNLPFLDIFYLIGAALLLYAIFRFLSKNLYKRQQENAKYLSHSRKFKGNRALYKKMWQERKSHRYFRCSCGTYLRVPKGRGKIKIHCSKCGKDIIKNT